MSLPAPANRALLFRVGTGQTKVKNQSWHRLLDPNLLHIRVVVEMFKNPDVCTLL